MAQMLQVQPPWQYAVGEGHDNDWGPALPDANGSPDDDASTYPLTAPDPAAIEAVFQMLQAFGQSVGPGGARKFRAQLVI